MSDMISLTSIAGVDEELSAAANENAGAPKIEGGCSSSSCGSDAAPGDMPAHIWEKVKDHPCYSEQAHHYFARMHVAVAPACNIQCNYCNRKYDCANESRPGVVSEKLTPEQAVKKVLTVASKVPQMSVVGIAGPGDALANPKKTFDTFEEIAAKAPDIKLCLSTNGLALPDHVDQIAALNVDHVTITMNAIDPTVGEKIYPWIFFEHKRRRGLEAATILRDRQLKGLEMLTERGILVKVNSVLIPGVNDEHLVEVNKAVKERGAFLHNIMPLISDPAHGTHFGLTGQRGPTARELKAVQDECEGGAKMMRHCRQCRADAVGLLGEDRSDEFTLDKIDQMDEVAYDPELRNEYREVVEKERADREDARLAALEEAQAVAADAKILVAVATKGGERINEHFGHAKEFQVYEVSGKGVKFISHRRVDLYCQGGYGEEDALDTIVNAISDCEAVLIAKIGDCPRQKLEDRGIDAVDGYAFEYIEESALAYFKDWSARQAGTGAGPRQDDAILRNGAVMAERAAG